MVWDLFRRTPPTSTTSSATTSRSSTASISSASSTASVPIVYDSKTSRVQSCDWKTFEHTEDLLEAEAEGTSLTADLKINIGSALKPMFTHFAFVDLSNLGSEVKRERREGRINQVFVRV